MAAYFALGSVYASAAINFWRRLHAGRVGRVIITLSLTLWAASLYVHPWIVFHPNIWLAAEHIWDLQKFFVTLGLLIALLEDEISENERHAFHDQLTGLGNRRLLEHRLLAAMKRGPAGLLLLDLNGFKEVNDSLGHQAGDELLCQVAGRLRTLVDKGDTLVRVGGDEFVIISTRDFDSISAAITNDFLGTTVIEGVKVHLTASIGTAQFPVDAEGKREMEAVSQLMRAADRRMYEHKSASRLTRDTIHTTFDPPSFALASNKDMGEE
jgi:diguanylate cyclase (GGDEF)-like protein